MSTRIKINVCVCVYNSNEIVYEIFIDTYSGVYIGKALARAFKSCAHAVKRITKIRAMHRVRERNVCE